AAEPRAPANPVRTQSISSCAQAIPARARSSDRRAQAESACVRSGIVCARYPPARSQGETGCAPATSACARPESVCARAAPARRRATSACGAPHRHLPRVAGWRYCAPVAPARWLPERAGSVPAQPERCPMRKGTSIALLTLSAAGASAGSPRPDGPHVLVHGGGKVSVAPDSAVVTRGASQRSADAAEAKRVVDRAVNALLEAAPRFKVKPDEMSASDLALHEDVDYDERDRRLPTTHIATREVKVRLGDLDHLGPWTDAALAA